VGLLFNLEVTVEVAGGDEDEEDLDELEGEAREGEAGGGEAGAGASGAGAGDGGTPSAAGAQAARPAAPRPPRPPRAPAGAAAGVGAQAGHPLADLKAAGLGPRRPDRVQYIAPSETGEATVVGATADEFAGVGRNALCPCGSGKKYKRCHGDPRLQN
jgi:preprotein translocase subunit SecA